LCDPLKTQSWRWRIQDNHQVNDFQGEVVHIKGPHDLEYLTVEQIDTVLPKSRFSTAARCYFSVSPCKVAPPPPPSWPTLQGTSSSTLECDFDSILSPSILVCA
jgi:hypothetical protein